MRFEDWVRRKSFKYPTTREEMISQLQEAFYEGELIANNKIERDDTEVDRRFNFAEERIDRLCRQIEILKSNEQTKQKKIIALESEVSSLKKENEILKKKVGYGYLPPPFP